MNIFYSISVSVDFFSLLDILSKIYIIKQLMTFEALDMM